MKNLFSLLLSLFSFVHVFNCNAVSSAVSIEQNSNSNLIIGEQYKIIKYIITLTGMSLAEFPGWYSSCGNCYFNLK
jgi:hypothetical protein